MPGSGNIPRYFVSQQKSLHFFAKDWVLENANGPGDKRLLMLMTSTWDSYLAHFRGAEGKKAIGDFSPSYFWWWPSRESIRERLPDAKIILMLRDPVQKAFSQYTHLIRDGRETLSFWDALQAEPERKARRYGGLWLYRESACYAESTERFLEYFGPDRMRIYFFEDLIRDPTIVLKDIFRFLGVSEHAQSRYQLGEPSFRRSAVETPCLDDQSSRGPSHRKEDPAFPIRRSYRSQGYRTQHGHQGRARRSIERVPAA